MSTAALARPSKTAHLEERQFGLNGWKYYSKISFKTHKNGSGSALGPSSGNVLFRFEFGGFSHTSLSTILEDPISSDCKDVLRTLSGENYR